MNQNWNYRVIEFTDESGAIWRAIHEVHYEQGKPIRYVEQPVYVLVLREDGEMAELGRLLDRLSEALDKPILTDADFRTGKSHGRRSASRQRPTYAGKRTDETGIALATNRHASLHTRPVVWEATLLDAGDGSGDVFIELPDALLERAGWHVGTVLDLTANDGTIFLQAI